MLAAVFLAAHVRWLAPALEDIDSINFALGLHDFDPARHQPHPPGYPVYIALGWISRAALWALNPSWEAARLDAAALAIWSAIGGAVALVAAWCLFRGLDTWTSHASGHPTLGQETDARAGSTSARTSTWAVALLAVAPLFWMSGQRPMSDMPGLAATLAAQALIVGGMRRPKLLAIGACLAGAAAGIRVQSLALTTPLLFLAVLVSGNRLRGALNAVGAVTVGVLVWALPLLAATGGVDGYWKALGSQAGEDFAWVDMIWSNPTPRRLALSLHETFALPWASEPLAVVVAVTAAGGLVVMALQQRRTLGMLMVAFTPYAAFHLLLQETATVRYALPLIPPVAWLAAQGVAAVGRLGAPLWIAVLLAAASQAVPAGIEYAREPHPAFRAIANMRLEAEGAPPAAVYAHYALLRPLQAMAPGSVPVVSPMPNLEWMGPAPYWRGGGTQSVWFLADPRRTDLAHIDPASVHREEQYVWRVADRPELRGSRPLGVDWYRLTPPGWFLGEGWSLTPETGGLTRASGKGLDHGPLVAYVRRRAEPLSMMIGGFHLGPVEDPATEITASLDDRVVDTWTFDHAAEGPSFLRVLRLPAGLAPGLEPYARLRLTARATVTGRPTPEVAIRQFDAQSTAVRPMLGFGEGWHEAEANPATGLSWRWTSPRAMLRVESARDVELVIRGESPLKYFDASPTVRLSVGDHLLGEYRPAADFEWRVAISAAALASADGAIAISTDKVYLPGVAEGTADSRRLGLRVWSCEVVVGP